MNCSHSKNVNKSSNVKTNLIRRFFVQSTMPISTPFAQACCSRKLFLNNAWHRQQHDISTKLVKNNKKKNSTTAHTTRENCIVTLTDLYNSWHYEITDENNELIIIMTMTTTTMTIFKTMLWLTSVAVAAAAATIISWRKIHSLMLSFLLFFFGNGDSGGGTQMAVQFVIKSFTAWFLCVFLKIRYVWLLPLLMPMIYELLAKWYARALRKTGHGISRCFV